MALKDGKYEGTSHGFEGKTKVLVIVEGGLISGVEVKEINDTEAVSHNAVKMIPQRIIAAQTTDIDVVSGATGSSQGLIEAAKNAMEKAGTIDSRNVREIKNTPSISEKRISNTADMYQEFDKEETTDLVIIGSGISGLSAAVQAGQDHINAVVLEKLSAAGGNGGGVEGQFALNSKRQQELGIKITPNEIMTAEHQMGQYRANGAIWLDLINSSAKNLVWCQKNGVEYSGKVDNYHTGLFNTFHWFKDRHASAGYVPQMVAKAKEYGVNFVFNTAAKHVLCDKGKVVGLIAETEDGKIIKYNTQAVVIASGGIGGNRSLIQKQGWNTDNMALTGMPSSVGDGYLMAQEVGAKDTMNESSQLIMNYVQAFPTTTPPLYMDPINGNRGFTTGGKILFVNEEGDRFFNENIAAFNLMLQSMAMKQNKANYVIFTRNIFMDFAKGKGLDNGADILDTAVKENKGNTLYESDTIAGLAASFGLPAENLVKTVQHYNDLCKQGKDTDFNKDTEMLTAIEKGPFYIGRVDQDYLVGIGGIGTNKRFEVIDDEHNAIPGLYATGMDGVMLYKNVYTMNMPGTACGFSVHSGRHAVKNAEKYFK